MTDGCIVGWAHSPFGRLDDDVEGRFSSGFTKQDVPGSLVLQAVPELRFKPAMRRENACASGSAAIRAARDVIRRGARAGGAGGRRREDDGDAGRRGRRQPARRLLPARGGRGAGRLRGRFRQHRRRLHPGPRRSIGRTGRHLGFAERGRGARLVLDGHTAADGRVPVECSGRLKPKGHSVGAMRVSMHVMAAMQRAGEARASRLPRADLAGVYNRSGAGVANDVSILERPEG